MMLVNEIEGGREEILNGSHSYSNRGNRITNLQQCGIGEYEMDGAKILIDLND